MRIAPLEESKLAKTGQDYLSLIAGDANWIVRTPEDLKQLAKVSAEAGILPED